MAILFFWNFRQNFGFRNLRSFFPSKVHIWTIRILFSIEKNIYGPYEPHISGRKSIYGPPVSIILERVLIYGPRVSLFRERVLVYGPQSVYISGGKSISLYFGCLNLYFGCLNLYRCTLGVWTYTLGVWISRWRRQRNNSPRLVSHLEDHVQGPYITFVIKLFFRLALTKNVLTIIPAQCQQGIPDT